MTMIWCPSPVPTLVVRANASRVPSGDQAGAESSVQLLGDPTGRHPVSVSWRILPESTSSTYSGLGVGQGPTGPIRTQGPVPSNATVVPSGDQAGSPIPYPQIEQSMGRGFPPEV